MKADKDDSQALIGLWQDEEMRLRSLIEKPQTSPSVKDQSIQRLNAVVEQISAIVDEAWPSNTQIPSGNDKQCGISRSCAGED